MLRSRRSRILATTLGAVGLVIGAQSQANAAGPVTIYSATGGGYGQWNPDPSGSIPGDSIRACDTTADGYGIETWLDINRNGSIDRIASTRGHNSPYCSPWASGNIAEGTPVTVYVLKRVGDTVVGPLASYNGIT